MAEIDEGLLKKGMTLSVRNIRTIDRTQLRGRTMQTMAAGFHLFEGAAPDYYDAGVGLRTTQYNYGGNLELVRVHGPVQVSLVLWENGKLNKGPVPSGTLLLNPRKFFDPRTQVVEDEVFVSGTVAIDNVSKEVIGDVTLSIPSGEIKNFVF